VNPLNPSSAVRRNTVYFERRAVGDCSVLYVSQNSLLNKIRGCVSPLRSRALVVCYRQPVSFLRIEIKRSLAIDAADQTALLELPHDTRVDKIVGLVLLGFGYCSEISSNIG
jgi:hypothetical protein